jgi:hypothetical protein
LNATGRGIVELIEILRQKMADSKFNEVEISAYRSLSDKHNSNRSEMLLIYLSSIKSQNKKILYPYLLEFVEKNLDTHLDHCLELINLYSSQNPNKLNLKLKIYLIKIFEKKGDIETLGKELKKLRCDLLEMNRPILNIALIEIEKKYFMKDFEFSLLNLTYAFYLGDLNSAENQILEIIKSLFESKNIKNLNSKLGLVGRLLEAQVEKKYLEIYQSYFIIRSRGITEKKDYKKIIEMMIFAKSNEFKVIILELLDFLQLEEIAKSYSSYLISEKNFKLLYVLKYFKNLKRYFMQGNLIRPEDEGTRELTEIGPIKNSKIVPQDDMKIEDRLFLTIEEEKIIHELKHQDLQFEEFHSLAISFIQAGYFYAAKESAICALNLAHTNEAKISTYYLIGETYYLLGDYRATIDFMGKIRELANDKIEIIPSMYLEAESHLKLNEKKEAKSIFEKINLTNENFRQTRDRLRLLNEY